MTIAVTVFAWLASESRRQAGEGRTASSPAVRSAQIPFERFELLAQFEAPAYLPHGAGSSPQFERAMQHYLRRDYPGAIPGPRLGPGRPPAPPARFYLVILYLFTSARPAR